jgi:hypothetical protein
MSACCGYRERADATPNGLDAWLENGQDECTGHVGMGMKLLEQKWRKKDDEWRKERWFSCAECTCGLKILLTTPLETRRLSCLRYDLAWTLQRALKKKKKYNKSASKTLFGELSAQSGTMAALGSARHAFLSN